MMCIDTYFQNRKFGNETDGRRGTSNGQYGYDENIYDFT